MAEEKVSSNAALYNKYRPSDFDSVYGQEDIVSSLSSAIEDGSLPHSFIFAGPRGTGKTSIARVVARALNCKNPIHGSPCGECESCRVPVSDAPGYYELDGASNAGVADARAIADEIRSGTSMADNRIFVIDEVQEMNSQAITALLKPLEEPPANTFIIFCTTDPERLPATIRSRGVTHYFNQVPDDKLTQLVIDTVEREGREPLDDETVQAVVMEGDGSPRDTLSVLQRVLMGGKAVMSGQGTILAQAIVERDLGGAIMAIAEAVSVGSTINALFSETASALRDIFICAHAPNLLSPARREDVESRFSDIEAASINARAAIIPMSEAHRVSRTGSEPRGIIEAAVISIIAGDGGSGSGSNNVSAPVDLGGTRDILNAIRSLSNRIEEIASNVGAISNWPATGTKQPPASLPTEKRSEAVNGPSMDSNEPGNAQDTESNDGDQTDDAYQEVLNVIIDEIMNHRGLKSSSAARRKKVLREIEDADSPINIFIDEETSEVVIESQDWSSDEGEAVMSAIKPLISNYRGLIVVTENGSDIAV